MVDGLPGFGENRVGAVQPPLQVTDGGNAEWVLPAEILLTVDPRPRQTGMLEGFLEGAVGDAGVHRRLDDL
ncbi:hypothetical protein ALO94_200067 [Pseudomonas syringae pv. spinaceae]|uniref:Uncharacterized protein n=1 Tax=Pseudomonas syringae pv. spinaceae TaxID=264459 RepID=A0A0Q0B1S9_PSESX|nr:hypothetical protein ALO94_200067 [Pseudomonas syringae pv. spinaceae]